MMLEQLPLGAAPLIFLDLETTGLHPFEGDRICEVALARVVGGHEVAVLDLLVNPGRPSSPGAQAVHQIDAATLAHAPPFATVVDTIVEALSGGILVAHNAPFDLGFLNAELLRIGRTLLRVPMVDTLRLSRRLLRRPSHSLAALAAEFAQATPTHRALADVRVLQQVFAVMQPLLAARGVHTVGDLLRFQRGIAPGVPEPEPPPLIAAALREGRLLRMVYRSRSFPEPVERVVQPIEISIESSGLYLRAFCHMRNDERAFALDKILELALVP